MLLPDGTSVRVNHHNKRQERAGWLQDLPLGKAPDPTDIATALGRAIASAAAYSPEKIRTSISRIEYEGFHALQGTDDEADPVEHLSNIFSKLRVEAERAQRLESAVRLFTTIGSEDIKETYDRMHRGLISIQAEVRSATDALAGAIAARQITSAERQRKAAESVQATAAAIASLLLAPAVIASVYGANVALPGSHGQNAFLAMFSFMIASALATRLVLARSAHRHLSTRTALACGLAIAIAAVLSTGWF
jgi:Mg2+ and Co2+ transporter CorA